MSHGLQTTVVALGVSKKPEAIRQAELLLSGKPALLAHLSQVAGGAMAAMLRAAGQCDIIVELCAGGSSGQDCCCADVSTCIWVLRHLYCPVLSMLDAACRLSLGHRCWKHTAAAQFAGCVCTRKLGTAR